MGGGSARNIVRAGLGVATMGASEAAYQYEEGRQREKAEKKAMKQAAAEQAEFERQQQEAENTATARQGAASRRDAARRRQASNRRSGRQGTLLGGSGEQQNEAGARTLLGS